jgi:hypothetical protein
MGDGTKEKPYTRKDVLRLLKENEKSGEVLDLSGKVFEEDIDLHGLDLGVIDLSESYLNGANLEGARLWGAILLGTRLIAADLKGANLRYAHLWEAKLFGVELEGADLRHADLGGAYLRRTEFPSNAKLEEVGWGEKYILGEEEEGYFEEAEATYRRLKIWYTEHGLYDIAAKFYYREKEAQRKDASRRRDRVAGWFSWAFFGHGEGWKRILIWIASCISLFTLIYFLIGTFCPSFGTLTPDTFTNSLYYSAVSFITLGYGSWVKEATGWEKGLGVFEAFLGFFMMTLLLVTFVRKWTR